MDQQTPNLDYYYYYPHGKPHCYLYSSEFAVFHLFNDPLDANRCLQDYHWTICFLLCCLVETTRGYANDDYPLPLPCLTKLNYSSLEMKVYFEFM